MRQTATSVIGFFLLGVFASQSQAAEINSIVQANNVVYTQTSATQPGSGSAQYFFGGQINMTNAGDFSAGNVATPNGQPTNGTNNGAAPDMALLTSLVWQYESPLLTAAAYTPEFPNGVYTYTATDSPNQTVTVDQTGPDYTTAIPYVTDFSMLQGLNPANALTLTWNPFTNALPGSTCPSTTGATCSFVFLDIFNTSSGADVFSDGFQPSTTTSVVIPGNTLLPNTGYTFQLIFDNRQITSYASGTASFLPEFLSDVRTLGSFTTAAATSAPEPGALGMTLAGIGLILARWRKRPGGKVNLRSRNDKE